MGDTSLYARLGGYDGISGFVDSLLPRLQSDALLARFWHNRGADGVAREKQLLIDFLCHVSGGPIYYTGREMALSHRGMGITEEDWSAFIGHADATMKALGVGEQEYNDVVAFVLSIKDDIVDP